MGICHVNKLVIGSKNTEKGSIQIYGKDMDVLKLGDATHEGGDISVYRDTSGNKQLFVDADAASNALAMSVYGGVVAQNYLSVGYSTLQSTYPLDVAGTISASSILRGPTLYNDVTYSHAQNISNMFLDLRVNTGTETHQLNLRIDTNDIIVAQATGAGDGSVTNLAIGLYGTTPATQHAAIADATDAASAITQLNLLLAANRAIGVIAT